MFILIIISLMLTGVGIGFLACKKKLSFIHRIITVLIWGLLFLLGTEVGHNEAIIQGLHTIGLEALLITLAGVFGSILASWGLWLYIRKHKKTEGGKA